MFEFHAVGDEFEFGPGRKLTNSDHSSQAFWCGIRENVVEIRWHTFGPKGDGAREFLQPKLAPILVHWARKQFEMTKNFQPFCHIEFEILLCGGSKEAATPSSSSAMSDWTTNCATRGEEE